MECGACHDTKRDLFCARCLHTGLKKHTEANHILTTQLKASKSRAERILHGPSGESTGLDAHRLLAARIYQLETQNAVLDSEVARRTAANQARRAALKGRREDLARRRAALEDTPVPDGSIIHATLLRMQRMNHQTAAHVIHARRVLVAEAIAIFGVQRAPGGTRDGKPAEEWEIAGLTMPPPARFTEYSATHLNAVFEHLVHLVSTITGYLDLVLPFTPQWQGFSPSAAAAAAAGTGRDLPGLTNVPKTVRAPHVGKIFLSAGTNIPFIHSPPPTPPTPTPTPAPSEDSRHHLATLQKRALLYVSSSREKYKRRQRKPPTATAEPDTSRDKQRDKEDHLNLSYSMLLLDLVYLAQTQGVAWVLDALEARKGSGEWGVVCPLRLVDDLRWSDGLGSASHAPLATGTLEAIVLPLPLAEVHAAVVAAFAEDPPQGAGKGRGERRGRGKEARGGELEVDDWDLV